MPSTYTLISSNVLSSSAASVTFSAIPSTYTDLVIRTSIRDDVSGNTTSIDKLTINGSSASNYSYTYLYADSTSPGSGRASNTTSIWHFYSDGASATASTFGSGEIYIPNYTVAQNRAISSIGVMEQNATNPGIATTAGLYRDTTAITSLTLYPPSGNFVSGSSFYLYGIKNS